MGDLEDQLTWMSSRLSFRAQVRAVGVEISKHLNRLGDDFISSLARWLEDGLYWKRRFLSI